MSRFRRRRQILAVILIPTLLSLVLLAVILRSSLHEWAIDRWSKDHRAFVLSLDDQIDDHIERGRTIIRFAAQSPEFGSLPDRARIDPKLNGLPENLESGKRSLLERLRSQGGFSVLFVLTPEGDHYMSHPFEVQRSLKKYNLADRPYFQEARKSREPVVSDSFVGADGVPAIAIDVPVVDARGEIVLHLGGVVHLARLSTLLAPSAIAPFDYAVLADRQGRRIAESDPARLAEPLGEPLSSNLSFKNISAGARAAPIDVHKINVIRSVDNSAKRWLSFDMGLENGWHLFLFRSEDSLLAEIAPEVRKVTLLAAGILLVPSLLGLGLAIGFSRRWQRADAALQDANATLETRIEERTAELQKSEIRHRTLFESTADAVVILGPSGMIDCNPAAIRMFGAARREDILGKYPADLSPEVQSNGEDSRLAADRQVAKMMSEGSSQFEWLHRRLDTGESFFVEVLLNRLEIDGQQLVQGTVRDITARKRVEEQLARQNSVLNTIVENFPGGVSLCDADLRVVILNSQFAKLLEFPDRLVNRDVVMFEDFVRYNAQRGEYGSGDIEEIVAAAMARARNFEAHQFERVRPSGTTLDIRGVPLAGGGFVTFYIDITERKQAEKALRESEELFRAVAQSANDAIVTADSSGDIIKWNKGAETIFGHAEAEVIGQPLTLLMPERFRDPHLAGMRRVASGGEPHVMGKPVELVGLRKDGSEFPLELSLAQWQAPEGRFFTGVIRDITDRKKIERQLEDQKAHLEELVQLRTRELTQALEAARLADQTKDVFLANMSHELRTPLNAVIGMAGLARNVATEPRQRDYLDKIVGAGSHLNRIINDLLDLSKIAAGHMEFENIAFSLSALLQRCRSVLEIRATENGLLLAVTIDEAVPDVLIGDPHRVEQILFNLLGNAIKFTPSGRVDTHVSLSAQREGRVCLQIDVTDTGIGMRDEVLQRLFMPFSQADSTVSRQFGGSGLGLAISRRLAEMMDGDISVSSQEGTGTTFAIRLWLGKGDGAILPGGAPAGEQALPSAYQDVRMLVAEDQPLNREIVEALLAAVGIVPRMAENGQEALNILSESGPAAFDLVLMDIQMPLMDGLTATRLIRKLDGFAQLPIIAMTAHTMAHEIEISATAGMNDHIGKPFDNDSFYRTLAKWIPREKKKTSSGPRDSPDQAAAGAGSELVSLRGIGIDVAAGLARFGGKEDRYRHWLREFIASAAGVPVQIRNEVAIGQADAAAKTAHTFKGRTGMLGMTELHHTVSMLETVLRDGTAADGLLGELERAIDGMNARLAQVVGAAETNRTGAGLEKLAWKKEYSVGVPAMDEQHKRLLDMINELADCPTGNAGAVHQILSAMFDYTASHFKDEEAYLKQIGYPRLAEHEEEHAAFVRKMVSFNLAAADHVIDAVAVHTYLKQWLVSHILSSDMQYGRFLEQGKATR